MLGKVHDVATVVDTETDGHDTDAIRNDIACDAAGIHEAEQNTCHRHDISDRQEGEVNGHGDQHCKEDPDECKPGSAESLILGSC